ncbi:MAG: hypothetical protein ACOYUZ_01140 [Patescibacteria group bacterium]
MKQLFGFSLVLILWLVCLPALADDSHAAALQARLDSENHQVREQAGQEIFNVGVSAPFGDARRLAAAKMLFAAWQKEANRQTAQRLLIWINRLGFRLQALRRIETIGGERPHAVIYYRLVPGPPPRPKPKTPKEPNTDVPDTAPPPPQIIEPPPPPDPDVSTSDVRRKPFNPSSLLPALASQHDTASLAHAARTASLRQSNSRVAHVPRMNSIHDQGPHSIDTDITNTCGTGHCFKRCPPGARCTPCEPRERRRLTRIREFVRRHPHATVVETSGLLNIIPIAIKLIQGIPVEQIFLGGGATNACSQHGSNNPNCLGIIPF